MKSYKVMIIFTDGICSIFRIHEMNLSKSKMYYVTYLFITAIVSRIQYVMERHMTKYSTFRMYDATFRMYDPTLLITHQHSEYAPTWQIRTNLPANTHQHCKYAPTCIRQYHLARYRRMQVGTYLRVHVDAYLQFTSVAF